MHPKGSCKCQHCGEMFVVHPRNRGRQRYCTKVPCRKARKANSQRRWLERPGNEGYFSGPTNVERVRAWRTLQDRLTAEVAADQEAAHPDDRDGLQDRLIAQSPLFVGLISHLAGSALQDDIAAMTRRLHSRGRAVLGTDVPRSAYGKALNRNRSGAARAAPV